MSAVQFCVRDGCYEVAVAAARSRLFCRGHYAVADEVLRLGELVSCEVVGPCLITDARTGLGVGKGSLVEVDPHETRVEQLVAAGHVKVVQPRPAKPASKPKG